MGATTQRMAYRRDIDGLRAVAILAVVFFHADFEFVSGGFVGVDVFFVISGYLIAGVIMGHKGSIGSFVPWFYERRIRRLAPPAIPVLLVTTLSAYAFLPPGALEEYAQSLMAFLGFVSNWYFWNISGYFDGPADFKPLLHTWSLSIEEQFYILFPIVVLVLERHGRRAVTLFFASVFAFSLGYSVYLTHSGQAELAFFNSFGRFWEIALGGLIACGVVRSPQRAWLKTAIGGTGFAAIIAAIIFYDTATPFPGLSAMVPTFGSAAVIIANGGLANRLLSTRPFVGVGLISYALYLWHWPIFVFIKTQMDDPSALVFAVGIVAAMALSIVSYFIVERPVRRKQVLQSRRAAFGLLGGTVLLFGSVGAVGAITAGLPGRFGDAAADYQAARRGIVSEWYTGSQKTVCWIPGGDPIQLMLDRCISPEPDGTSVLVIGDSHAAHLLAGLTATFPEQDFDLLASNSCAIGEAHLDRRACDETVEWINTTLPSLGYAAVIVSSRTIEMDEIESIADQAESIAAYTRVYFFGPIQLYLPPMPELYPTIADYASPAAMDAALDQSVQAEQFGIDAHYRVRFSDSPVHYISLLAGTCPQGREGCRHFTEDGWPVHVDPSHMSAAASRETIASVAHHLQFAAHPTTSADAATRPPE